MGWNGFWTSQICRPLYRKKVLYGLKFISKFEIKNPTDYNLNNISFNLFLFSVSQFLRSYHLRFSNCYMYTCNVLCWIYDYTYHIDCKVGLDLLGKILCPHISRVRVHCPPQSPFMGFLCVCCRCINSFMNFLSLS